jgi:hypothetical protein
VDACADYLLQLRLAAVTRFANVPAYLTANRVTNRNMSANALRMLREHVHLLEILMPDLPAAHRSEAEKQLATWRARLALVMLKRGNLAEGSAMMCSALAGVPTAALREAVDRIRDRSFGTKPATEVGRPFLELGPQEHLA